MEYKSISQSFKDVDAKEGIVTGYFSSFGNVDSDGDVIHKGAFKRAISEWGPQAKKRIKHLLDHDLTKAVGVITLLQEDDHGLYYESKAGRHTLGQDFLKMAEDGIITEHSIGYKITREEKGEGFNNIFEVKMYEGSSLQTWGANENTPMSGIKSLQDALTLLETLEKAIKNGTYSDEALIQIEAKYKSLTEFFKTTQPDADLGKTTAPDEEEEKAKKGKIIIDTFKQALKNGRGSGIA